MALQSANIPDIIVLDQWKGMSRQAGRSTIDDQECWWLENLIPLGPGQLRSAWGASAPIWTAPGGVTILRMFVMNISGTQVQAFLFLSDSTVQVVNLPQGTSGTLGAIWTPVAAQAYPADMKLWIPSIPGGQVGGAVIGSPRGLYAVDANLTVTAPGAAAPTWLTNGQTGFTMPSGLPGIYAMEVYKQRLFVAGQTVIAFSAPSNGADFSAADGGGAFAYFGDLLTVTWTDLQSSAGFLYLMSDSAIGQITDLSLGPTQTPIGTVSSTQFLDSNVDPQVGEAYMRPVSLWEQAITLNNGPAGIYLLVSGQSQWASAKVTNVLQTVSTASFVPTQCAVHIFGQKFILFNATMTDPDGVTRSMMLAWSGPGLQQWLILSQNLNLTHIASHEQSSLITAWGTDGNSLYQLFARPDPTLIKRLQTKNYTSGNYLTIKDWKRAYIELSDNGTGGVSLTGTQTTLGGGIPNGVQDVAYSVDPRGGDVVPSPTLGKGIMANLDLRSTSPDFNISRISITFDDRTLFGA
jgi:hypothetical protein